jgi:uncharacterized pyridoxamine 5'-phosphate oxidase family protein
MSKIQEIIDFLAKSPAFYVGTVDESGKPHVRPFSFVMEWEGKLTFVTNTTKDVYKQIKLNPNVDICSFAATGEWARIGGDVKLFQSVEANRKVFEVMPELKKMYTSAENPILACFSFEKAEAVFFSFESMDKPFKVIKL